jgi:hypothetical protein
MDLVPGGALPSLIPHLQGARIQPPDATCPVASDWPVYCSAHGSFLHSMGDRQAFSIDDNPLGRSGSTLFSYWRDWTSPKEDGFGMYYGPSVTLGTFNSGSRGDMGAAIIATRRMDSKLYHI